MSFFVELWQSILTPGTTPALVTATHASFFALVVTLVGMLVSTRNIHFVFLTIIAVGVWGGITWFVSEVEKIKREQAEAEEAKGEKEEAEGDEKAEIEKEEQDVKAPKVPKAPKTPKKTKPVANDRIAATTGRQTRSSSRRT